VADLQRRDGVFTVDCHYLGINNVMVLRGDAMKDEQSFAKDGGNNFVLI
jgi:methylenetetrahydrofolate reductase (NADPH)